MKNNNTKTLLKNVCKISKGKGLKHEKVNFTEGQKCILCGDLFTQYDTVIKNVVHKTTYNEGIGSKKNTVLIPGDTTTNAWDIAKAVALDEENVLLGGSINILEFDDYCDNTFFAYYLSSKKRIDLAKLAIGSTVVHLHGKEIGNIEVSYPSKEMQVKIGSFFKELDELIEMYEEYRKIITVCKHNYSSYFFQKASIKIRIRDLGNVKTGKTPSTKVHDNFGGTVLWATPKDLSSKYILQTERSLTKKGLSSGVEVPKDSVLVCCVGSFGKIGISQENMSCNQQINFIYNCNFDHEYIYYLIENHAKKIESFAQDGVVKILPLEQFKNIPITIHTDEDIKKFVPIMKLFDDLIDEIEQLTKYYREFKKFYLNKIFN